MTLHRHGRACPGHPRLVSWIHTEDVDARDKRGHDGVASDAIRKRELAR
jgi:hypothetical protein